MMASTPRLPAAFAGLPLLRCYAALTASHREAGATRSVLDHRPRRALLYVPGDSERKIQKASSGTGADTVCLDLEDAVAANRKQAARDIVTQALASLSFGRSEVAVRLNSVESGHAEDDLRALLGSATLPQALVVPKVEGVEHVRFLFDRVRQLGGARLRDSPAVPALITMCESGTALLSLRSVFAACLAEGGRAPLRLEACIFGGDDFCASLGLKRRPGGEDTAFARQWVVLHARTFGVQPIDQVWIDYKDPGGLRSEAEQGRRLGMMGKQVIHPSQVAPVQAAFSPEPSEVEEARQLVNAFEQHQAAGVGAFTFRDRMIDSPTYLQARALVRFADRTGA